MATTHNVSFVFIILSALFLQLHCRESQFFSKFSNNKPKENELLPTTIQPQQQPDFIPQTEDSAGYGLYGQLPPSTTTNNLPTTFPENYNTYTTSAAGSTDSYESTDPQYDRKNQDNDDSSMYNNQKQEKLNGHLPPLTTSHAAINGGAGNNLPENYYPVAYTTPIHHKDSYETTAPQYREEELYNNEGSMYNQFMYNSGKEVKGEYEGDMYKTNKQGMSDVRVLDNGKYYHVGDMYNSNKQGFMDNLDSEMYNTEKQGMSDTRSMENGKYHYDPNSESVNVNDAWKKNGYYGNNNVNEYSNRRYYENNVKAENRYNFNADEVLTP